MKCLLHYLRTTVLRHEAAAWSDAQLLESFLAYRDEAAFTTLVHRHGPMVLAVARRWLGHLQDAEDAFQATFLLLAQKAATIRNGELLSTWLFEVVYRIARKVRALNARRRARETPMDTMLEPAVVNEEPCGDLRRLLDEELNRLAAKYRVAVVLCDLEGRSRREVAQQLRIPEGTLSSRLATARRQLAKRLTRRGLAISAGTVAEVTAHTSHACPSVALTSATVESALGIVNGAAAGSVVSPKVLFLMKGVARAMLLTKLKTSALVVVAVGLTGLTLTAISQGAWVSTTLAPAVRDVIGAEKAMVALQQAPAPAPISNADTKAELEAINKQIDALQKRRETLLQDQTNYNKVDIKGRLQRGKNADGNDIWTVTARGITWHLDFGDKTDLIDLARQLDGKIVLVTGSAIRSSGAGVPGWTPPPVKSYGYSSSAPKSGPGGGSPPPTNYYYPADGPAAIAGSQGVYSTYGGRGACHNDGLTLKVETFKAP